VPADGETPEFCRVMGQILPEIRFDVSLPSSWNRRFLMTGNGSMPVTRWSHPNGSRNTVSPCGGALSRR
jgi:hypothetical protein